MQYANCQEKAYHPGLVCINAESPMTMEASLREYVGIFFSCNAKFNENVVVL